ncbi:hypothetical protein DMENIID0001_061980 [Sergentomyia squamirostris]
MVPTTQKTRPYSPSKLIEALNSIENGMPVRRAALSTKFHTQRFTRRLPENYCRVKKRNTGKSISGKVTREKIEQWFNDVEEQLGEHVHILQHPERVFNADETAFTLTSEGQYVLAARARHVYIESNNSDKERITTLFTVNAVGKFAPPLTIYKYDRLPSAAYECAPSNWGIGKSESGWMTSAIFYEYIGNVFLKFLDDENIQRPVILFLDGHTSHLTLHLSKLCRDNGIVLVALYPNSTHILQPLDVAVFKSLKSGFGARKMIWRNNHGKYLQKFDVPCMLSKVIRGQNMVTNIINGFLVTGLCPFDMYAVDYSKVIERGPVHPLSQIKNELQTQVNIEFFESQLQPDLLIQFQNDLHGEWTGDIRNEGLFDTWKKMKSGLESSTPQKKVTRISGSSKQFINSRIIFNAKKKQDRELKKAQRIQEMELKMTERNQKKELKNAQKLQEMESKARKKQKKDLIGAKKNQEMELKVQKKQDMKMKKDKNA